MKIDSFCSNYYNDFVVKNPFCNKAYWLVAETVKVTTTLLFLNLLSQRWVQSASLLARRQFVVATVLMPVVEEVVCRFFVLRGVQFAQKKWNQHVGKTVLTAEEEQRQQIFRVHFAACVSTILHLSRYPYNKQTVVYQALMAYVNGVGCGYLNDKYQRFSSGILLNGLHHFFTNAGMIDFAHFSVLGIASGHILMNLIIKHYDIEACLEKVERVVAVIAFLDQLRQNFITKTVKVWKQNPFIIIVQAPISEEFLFRGVTLAGILLLQIMYYDIVNAFCKMVGKQKAPEDKRFQQIFRVYLSAFIFAAVHLKNPHENIQGACQQFIWTYLLGVSYGYLTEKYENLAESILFHGLNNFLTTLTLQCPPQLVPYCVVAIFVNQAAAYALAITDGKSCRSFCLTAVSYGMRVFVGLHIFLKGMETNPTALVAWSVHQLVVHIRLSQDQMIDYVHTKMKQTVHLMGG